MKPTRVIVATEMGSLAVAVFGDLASSSDPTLPKPRIVAGILVFYAILGLVASFGRGPAKVAAAAGALTFLVTLVGTGVKGSGQGGKNLLRLFKGATHLLTGGTA